MKPCFDPNSLSVLTLASLLLCQSTTSWAQEPADQEENQPQKATQPSLLDKLLAEASQDQTEAASEPKFVPFAPLEEIPPISDGLRAPAIFDQEMPLGAEDLRLMQEYQRELAQRLRSATCVIRIGEGSGSGVFVSHDGLIASAAHVTGRPGAPLTVVLPDGRELKARALTADPSIDGSFAMIEPGQLETPVPWVELAEMGQQNIADWTLACGNSGGWDAERGSVIRVGRLVRLGSTGTQTDAPLIGGDSGGPLIDINGRLLGTNSRVGGTARHSLHVPLPYFHGFFQEAQEQFTLANSAGVDALIESLQEPPAAEASSEAEPTTLDELLDQAHKDQQSAPLQRLLEEAREAQQATPESTQD